MVRGGGVRHSDTHLLFDCFFRILSRADSVRFVTDMARGLCVGRRPIGRSPDPDTYVDRTRASASTGKKHGKGKARECTPETGARARKGSGCERNGRLLYGD